jgi:hypothetical protein
MHSLQLRIGLGEGRSRLAQPETQLAKHPLALTYSQTDPTLLFDPRGQRLAIPDVSTQTRLARRLAQNRLDLLHPLLAQPSRPPRSFALPQPGQAFVLKAVHPVFNRSWRITQQSRNLWTGQPLGHQQHSMQAMVVTGLL